MRPDLDAKLCADFPEIFKNRNASMQATAMCWGFECDDGWEPIIRGICQKLAYLASTTGATFTAGQVKEKYGSLAFYYSTEYPMYATSGEARLLADIADCVVARAEDASAITCEECGAAGHTRGNGWLKTLCAQHAYAHAYPITTWEADILKQHIPNFDEKRCEVDDDAI